MHYAKCKKSCVTKLQKCIPCEKVQHINCTSIDFVMKERNLMSSTGSSKAEISITHRPMVLFYKFDMCKNCINVVHYFGKCHCDSSLKRHLANNALVCFHHRLADYTCISTQVCNLVINSFSAEQKSSIPISNQTI